MISALLMIGILQATDILGTFMFGTFAILDEALYKSAWRPLSGDKV